MVAASESWSYALFSTVGPVCNYWFVGLKPYTPFENPLHLRLRFGNQGNIKDVITVEVAMILQSHLPELDWFHT